MLSQKLLSSLFRHQSKKIKNPFTINIAQIMDGKRPEHLQLTATQMRDPSVLDAKIVEITNLSPTVKGFKLSVKDGNDTTFKAGQWVDFFIPTVDMVGGFSMWGPPSRLEKDSMLDLAVKYSNWPPANWLHTQAKEGDIVSVRIGGEFSYPNYATTKLDDHNVVLIAGGVGINPLASIFFHIKDLKEKSKSKCGKVHLMFSAKSKEELLFKDAFEKIINNNSDFTAEYFTTKEGRNSRIDANRIGGVIEKFSTDSQKPLFYICGPPQMIKDMNLHLLKLNVPKSNIFFELWW